MVNWHKNDHDQYPTLTSFKVKKKKEEMKKGVEYLERCSCGKIHYGDVGINHGFDAYESKEFTLQDHKHKYLPFDKASAGM